MFRGTCRVHDQQETYPGEARRSRRTQPARTPVAAQPPSARAAARARALLRSSSTRVTISDPLGHPSDNTNFTSLRSRRVVTPLAPAKRQLLKFAKCYRIPKDSRGPFSVHRSRRGKFIRFHLVVLRVSYWIVFTTYNICFPIFVYILHLIFLFVGWGLLSV